MTRDWWGYNDDHDHRKNGKQVRALVSMINTLPGTELLATTVRGR